MNKSKTHVNAEPKWDPSLHAAEIGVEVKGGMVILSGDVTSGPGRNMARHSVWNSPGVRTVVDNMTVAV